MKKIINKDARRHVENLIEFKANNLKGVIEGRFFVVYSYNWYPLFAHDMKENKWFGNADKYSVSTSKQFGQCHPMGRTVTMLGLEDLKDLIQAKG